MHQPHSTNLGLPALGIVELENNRGILIDVIIYNDKKT
jgi:hypothetical protein